MKTRRKRGKLAPEILRNLVALGFRRVGATKPINHILYRRRHLSLFEGNLNSVEKRDGKLIPEAAIPRKKGELTNFGSAEFGLFKIAIGLTRIGAQISVMFIGGEVGRAANHLKKCSRRNQKMFQRYL